MLFLGTAPARIQLPPYGALRINPIGLATLPLLPLSAPSGKGTLAFTVPSSSALAGLLFWTQALVLPSANPADARFTNVQAERIWSH